MTFPAHGCQLLGFDLHSPPVPIKATPRAGRYCSTAARPTPSASLLQQKGGRVQRELNILALIKGTERYVFVYDDESRDALVNVLRDQAADPRLTFSWFDASVLTQKLREQAQCDTPSPPAARY